MKAKLNTPTKVAKKGVFGSLRGALRQSFFQLAENVADPEADGTDSSSQEDEDEQEAPEVYVGRSTLLIGVWTLLSPLLSPLVTANQYETSGYPQCHPNSPQHTSQRR
jgi:hypothetical protein